MAKVHKSDAEWRRQLSEGEYYVTRQAGTEPPYSHPGFPEDEGYFACVCCGAPLFSQEAKFESHCGWPAFSAPNGQIDEIRDTSLGMVRTEVRCHECDAHLGHVFPDGPPPTGLRYCINGLALRFVPAEG